MTAQMQERFPGRHIHLPALRWYLQLTETLSAEFCASTCAFSLLEKLRQCISGFYFCTAMRMYTATKTTTSPMTTTTTPSTGYRETSRTSSLQSPKPLPTCESEIPSKASFCHQTSNFPKCLEPRFPGKTGTTKLQTARASLCFA